MSEFRKLLMTCIQEAARQLRIPPRVYVRENVGDFFADHDETYYSAQQYVAKAIEYLCGPDSEANDLMCVAAATFLDETVGVPPGDAKLQRVQDLREIINSGRPLGSHEIENWASGWNG